ncbi:MAG: DUF4317 domain-containing protein [Lachnospiraceae bacterium]|nr:DUF4317 domain-containing protein [Lachnospiraceae bacterium]
MNRRELNEIKAIFEPDNCENGMGIRQIAGAYFDGEGKEIVSAKEDLESLRVAERLKYFEIFRKVLSGTPGKNQINPGFSDDAYAPDGGRGLLMKLRDSELKDDEALSEFFQKTASRLSMKGNFLILLAWHAYDLPVITADGIRDSESSDEVFRYIICAVCPVSPEKGGLAFDSDLQRFRDLNLSMVVDAPVCGFLFPAFNDRTSDEDSLQFYSKNANDLQSGFLEDVLSCRRTLGASEQKDVFCDIVKASVGDDINFEVAKKIDDNLREFQNEQKAENKEKVPSIDQKEARKILEKSGVPEEKLETFEEQFEMQAGEDQKLAMTNLTKAKDMVVKTPSVVVHVKPEDSDLLQTREIDGEVYLVIRIDENLSVNGISVNPGTGEVTEYPDSAEETPEEEQPL